ncbi:MAG: hypothetical protein RIE08_07570 [Acidimicrobiales bacterium]
MSAHPTLEDCRAELAASFADHVTRHGLIERRFTVAGTPIMIRFAGERLVEFLSAAYGHLPRPPETVDPAVVIDTWSPDPDATLPPLPREAFPETPEQARIAHRAETQVHYDWDSRTLALHDLAGGHAWSLTADPDKLPWWVRAAPLKLFVARQIVARGATLLHSAAVARNGDAVLLTGPSGSGKSTTSLRCTVGGLGFLGDDYCVATPADGRVHSIFGTAKCMPHETDGFEALTATASPRQNTPNEKLIFWPARVYPDQMVADAAIRGVVALTVGGSASTTVEPMTGGAALRALAPSTITQLPVLGQGALSAMAQITSSVPCWQVTLGSDRQGVVDAIAGILDRGHP